MKYLGGLGLLFTPLLALAQGGLLLVDPPPDTGHTLSYGGTLFVFPKYLGAQSAEALPIPALEVMDSSGAFFSTDIGLGYNFSGRKDVQIGVRLYPSLPRRSGDDGHLHGIPDIPWRLERTVFANYWPLEFLGLQSSVRTGLGPNEDGVLTEAGMSVGAPVSSVLTVGGTLGMSYANANFRQSFFGVSGAVSQLSGYPQFQAGAGWQDFQTSIGFEWKMDQRLRMDVRLDQWKLLGAAGASPLTQSRWQRGLVFSVWHDLD